jgi:hypothetical protein
MYFSQMEEPQKENDKAALTVNETDLEDEDDDVLVDEEVLDIPYQPEMNSDIGAKPLVFF